MDSLGHLGWSGGTVALLEVRRRKPIYGRSGTELAGSEFWCFRVAVRFVLILEGRFVLVLEGKSAGFEDSMRGLRGLHRVGTVPGHLVTCEHRGAGPIAH